jgi:RNA polymerase sigma-70 factor, ECF subfamily
MADPERKPRLVPLGSPYPVAPADAALVKSVAEGDKEALRTVWDRYAASVRSTLRSCLGRDAAIEDLVQEVFLGFYRSAGRIREPSALRPYLLGAAAKAASLEIRSRSRRRRWYDVYRLFRRSSSDGAGSSQVEGRDALRTLHDLLARIPPRERHAFILRYVQDLTPTEVAQALGIPLGTAKRAIAQGRSRVFLRARNEPALMDYLHLSHERT